MNSAPVPLPLAPARGTDSRATPGVARAAFSLAELVVAIGILVLMLSLAGQVFTITVQSTGKATALTEVSQQLRLFEETLRADLAAVDRERTLLVIQANPVNAFWTQDNLEAGTAIAAPADASQPYPHAKDPDREDANGNLVKPRADILFFYTARPASSYLDPQVTSNLQQVMYGHAELGEYVWDAGTSSYQFNKTIGDPADPQYFPAAPFGTNTFYPDPAEPSRIPAQQWHLARRSTLFVPTGTPPGAISPPLFGPGPAALSRQRLLAGAADVVTLQNPAINLVLPFEALAVNPICRVGPINYTGSPPYFLPYILSVPGEEPFLRSWLDVTPPPSLLNDADGDTQFDDQFYGLGHYMLPNCASFKVEWALDPRSSFVDGRLDGLTETLWFDSGAEEPCPANTGNTPDPLCSLAAKIKELDDKNPPAGSADGRLLSNLKSLLNDRVCLTTEPQLSQLCGSVCDPQLADFGVQFSLADRFRGKGFPGADGNCAWTAAQVDSQKKLALDGRMNFAIFTSGRPSLHGEMDGISGIDEGDFDYQNTVPDPMFPGALRITVDVFDNRGRLDRPIRHVMVIPIGS